MYRLTDDGILRTSEEIFLGGYYDRAVVIMDKEIYNDLYSNNTPCNAQEEYNLLCDYMKRHKEKFGKDFTIEEE